MIKLPRYELTPQENEDLATLYLALFLNIKDERLIAMISKETREDRIEMLRDSPMCETLYEMVKVFGEGEMVKFITPSIKKLAKMEYKQEGYLEAFEESFKEIM